MPRLTFDGVTKVFERPGGERVRALSELNLRIEDKECLALVGPSGSGKTTALRLIAGLDEPTGGTISIGQTVVNGLAPKRRDVGMVFQNPALYPHMTVRENLGFGLKLRKCPRPEADRRVREVAERLGLGPLLQSRPPDLSAGQRQRVAIGRALVRRATVLLLDEPLVNVDPSLRAQMASELAELRREFATTMIYVTHDHLEAMAVGDRVAVLREGVLEQCAPPQTLYRRPANVFVAGFIGSPPMNFFEGAIVRQANDLFFEAETPAAAASGEARRGFTAKLPAELAGLVRTPRTIVMGLRPEHIAWALDDALKSRGALVLAELVSVQCLGPDTFLRARVGGVSFVARALCGIDAAGRTNAKVAPCQEYAFRLDVKQACFFDPDTGKAIL